MRRTRIAPSVVPNVPLRACIPSWKSCTETFALWLWPTTFSIAPCALIGLPSATVSFCANVCTNAAPRVCAKLCCTAPTPRSPVRLSTRRTLANRICSTAKSGHFSPTNSLNTIWPNRCATPRCIRRTRSTVGRRTAAIGG